MGMGLPELLVLLVLIVALVVVFGMIFSKAGFSAWLGLLMLIPLVNVCAVLFLAFAEWPVHRELNQLKQQLSSKTG